MKQMKGRWEHYRWNQNGSRCRKNGEAVTSRRSRGGGEGGADAFIRSRINGADEKGSSRLAMHDEAGDPGGFKVRDDQGGQGGFRGMSGRRRCSKA